MTDDDPAVDEQPDEAQPDEQQTNEAPPEREQTDEEKKFGVPEESAVGEDDRRLSIEDASFAFGAVTILDDASLDFGAGTLTAMVGPNGSGKTTVLELLAGLRAPDSGSVSRPEGRARSVAYLPQSPQFRSGFTVRETLGFYLDLADDDRTPADLLERVGLASAADRPVAALSGGMTRLLGLAQALVGEPPVVVLDEPTSGLDPDVADHIFETVGAIATDGRTVVIASHDLAAVEAVADRVVTLVDGSFVQDGAPEELRRATGAATLREAFSDAVRGAERRSVEVDRASRGGEAE